PCFRSEQTPRPLLTRCGQLLDDAVIAFDELGRVETVVRLAEELERADAVVRQRGPAEGHVQLFGRERRAQLRAQFGGLAHARSGEDRELVAADARQLVAGADRLPESVGETSQLDVPGGVAVRVVDLLEVVHVAQKQNERLLTLAASRERLVEDAGVENAGEKV